MRSGQGLVSTSIGGWAAVALVAMAACSAGGEPGGGTGGQGAATAWGGAGGADFDAGAAGADPGCEPPDMLLVLDRTTSMHRTPAGAVPPDTEAGRATSKWALAIGAIEAVTARLETTVRFGLELFPRDPGDGSCVTLSERIGGVVASNPPCEQGEVGVAPALETAGAIADGLDPDTTTLCDTTPLGPALEVARDTLAALATGGRGQHALLISDGRDTCDSAAALALAHELAAAGARLYVVGFEAIGGDGLDPELLNDLACAGRTAVGFATNCADDGSGRYTSVDPGGAPLYYVAEDGDALVDALEDVAGSVCCHCTR